MRKIPYTRAAVTRGEEVLEVEPDDHAPARVQRRVPERRAPAHEPVRGVVDRDPVEQLVQDRDAAAPSAASSAARSRAAGRPRAAGVRSGSGAGARPSTTRSSPRTSANHASSPMSSSSHSARSPTVSIRGTGQRARTVCGMERSARAAPAAASAGAAAAPRARSRRRRRARAGRSSGGAVVGPRTSMATAPATPAVRAPAAPGPPSRRPPTHRRGTRRRGREPVSRERSATCDDAARRLSSCVRVGCTERQRRARDALLWSLRPPQGNPGDAPPGVRARAGIVAARTILEALPEGDTIHYAANKIRPVLEGRVPD